jgi:hypothetical protein
MDPITTLGMMILVPMTVWSVYALLFHLGVSETFKRFGPFRELFVMDRLIKGFKVGKLLPLRCYHGKRTPPLCS